MKSLLFSKTFLDTEHLLQEELNCLTTESIGTCFYASAKWAGNDIIVNQSTSTSEETLSLQRNPLAL